MNDKKVAFHPGKFRVPQRQQLSTDNFHFVALTTLSLIRVKRAAKSSRRHVYQRGETLNTN